VLPRIRIRLRTRKPRAWGLPPTQATTFRLARTGEAPLVLEGKQLAEASNEPENGEGQIWHKIALYLTASGRHLLEVVTSNVDKGPQHDVFSTFQRNDESWAAVFEKLRTYDPLRYVHFSENHQEGRQESWLVKDRFCRLVREFAERLGAEEWAD
jgi:hypothetical protein